LTLHTISYGGGVQSTALLALAAVGKIPHRTFLFANTGDDSEHPDTIEYVRNVAAPYAEKHGIALIELEKDLRGGGTDTILGKIERTARSEVIPVRSSADGPPMSRSCTIDFKIKVLGKWLKQHGATEENPAHVGVGISLDEIHRANRKPNPYERITYPLLGAMPGDPECCKTDLKVRRSDCDRIIRDAGLDVPPKSSCFFCPHHSFNAWVELRTDRPDLFEKSAQIEDKISEKAGAPRYLTRYGIPLREAIPDGVDMLDFDDADGSCMSGVCAT
jgi:hypothetical protein